MNLSQDETRLQESPRGNSVRVPRWKRVLDIACILVALPFLIPLALFIAVMIKIRSAGPVLFSQERIGYLGRRFICPKFRTMVVGADTATHHRYFSHLVGSNVPMEKLDSLGDPRIVPYGLLLRSSGLDELPQVINVLQGKMSLVGPRPCLPDEYDNYLPWHRERFNTLPGLTGLWQVSGKNRTTFDEMIHLDIHYARNKSLWLDLKIMLRTVPVLIVQVLERRRKMGRTSAPRSTEGGDLSSVDQSTAVTK
jgi:lipopolysaccharide/colanic/teichoic acid biosynthesis glycosyltransferase